MSDELIRSLRGNLTAAEDAVRLGVAMRQRQAEYFATRSRDALIASKTAEAAFDKAAKAVLEGEPEMLFGKAG